jgi:outer membrane receptor for Fe3+-dicitrate
MKAFRPTLILFANLVALTTLQGGEAKKATDGGATPANGTKAGKAKVTVTGSLIPVDAKDARHTATRASGSVVVLTGKDLQRMGAVDLADALRRGIATGH